MPILNTMHPTMLFTALQHNLNAAVLSQQSRQIEAQASPAAIQSWSAVPFPYFNIVSYADKLDEAVIADILQPYRTRQSTAVWFRLPTAQPKQFDEYLLAQGLTLLDRRPCMAIAIDAIPRAGPHADIVPVQSESQCRDWAMVQSLSSGGFPADVEDAYVDLLLATLNGDGTSQAFVAYAGGQAVACSLLLQAGGVAGIWQVGTIPDARRRGYGTAITHAPLLAAAQRGYKIGVLIATQMGRLLYQKMGFQEIAQANVYLFEP